MTADDLLEIELTDNQGSHQFRISQVQLINWGAYMGLHTMDVSRSGTVLLGPSGRGKSTLLDAMSAVIMPNPQDFNQAARDDRGTGRQRTVYSYARGYTSTVQDDNEVSTSKQYLRPPGSASFVSGAAITWETKRGQRATSLRLAWVGTDATDQEAVNRTTMYGFVNDQFDLRRLEELRPTGRSQSPLAKTAFEPLLDVTRGDVIDSRQAVLHARMRSVLGLGSNDKSQERALDLLRRAQSSKGIGTINKLFTALVLTEPAAMGLWSTVLESYQETSRLYTLFEDARRQFETLAPLPDQAQRYREAQRDAVAKRRMTESVDGEPARFDVWHAEKVYTWAQDKIDTIVLDKADLKNAIQASRQERDDADLLVSETIQKITAAGGDQSALAEIRLEQALAKQSRIEAAKEDFGDRLGEFGLVLPDSAGDLDLTVGSLGAILDAERQSLEDAKAQVLDTSGAHARVRDAATDKDREITRLAGRRTLIPEYAADNRHQIAQALQIDEESLAYGGELMEIQPEHRLWEKALVRKLHPLASTLLVHETDYKRVRRYVHDTKMRNVVHVEPVLPRDSAPHRGQPGSIVELIQLHDHEYSAWVLQELRERYNYRYVDREQDLDQPLPNWARGAITSAGMTTDRRPGFTKDDRDFTYPWIGRDPRRLIEHLRDELESLQAEVELKHSAAIAASVDHQRISQRIQRLEILGKDLTWDKIDTHAVDKLVCLRTKERDEANSPEVNRLKDDLEDHLEAQSKARSEYDTLDTRAKSLNADHGDWCTAQDRARDVTEPMRPLDADERQRLATLPFKGPDTPDGVQASRAESLGILDEQIKQHRKDHELLETAILSTISAYLNLDERIARNYDKSIGSLEALLHTQEQLERDRLPQAKAAWLERTDKDLNTALNRLLTQIESDKREIKNAMKPINDVLASVRFRQTSKLGIEPQATTNLRRLDEFTASIKEYTSNTVGQDVQRDAEQIETSFLKLRTYLSRLEDQSRSNEEWRRSVFDAREHFDFRAIEHKADGTKIIHQGVAGMSGGEGQELIAFLLAAALRLRLSEGRSALPQYASIILDEGFVKADSEFTGRSLSVLKVLGFQLIVGAPREKANAFEDYMDSVAYISRAPDDDRLAQIYPMTMEEAIALEAQEQA